jgi:hypothetical protein
VTYALLRVIPRRLVDWAIARQFRRGGFETSELIAPEGE